MRKLDKSVACIRSMYSVCIEKSGEIRTAKTKEMRGFRTPPRVILGRRFAIRASHLRLISIGHDHENMLASQFCKFVPVRIGVPFHCTEKHRRGMGPDLFDGTSASCFDVCHGLDLGRVSSGNAF